MGKMIAVVAIIVIKTALIDSVDSEGKAGHSQSKTPHKGSVIGVIQASNRVPLKGY